MERLLIVPDTHAPYHDERAWKLMLKVARVFKPQTIIHLGDLVDCYSLSAHSRDPSRTLRWVEERTAGRELRKTLDALKPQRKVFIEGNHEYRLVRYIEDKAPDLHGSIQMDWELRMSENGWEYVPYREHAKVGKVYFTHDTGNSGKYTTARAMETFGHSVVLGHHHQMQYAVMGDATGKNIVGAQFGWLGDPKQADYMHRIKALRSWSLGFGVGYKDSDGLVFLTPIPIVQYRCCVEGRIFRG